MSADKPRRAILTIAKPPAPSRGPSLSLVKKALRLYKGRGIPKAVYRRNALAWLRMKEWLGDHRHILNPKAPAKWGRPGDPVVKQLRSPRRLGEQS